MSKYKYDCLKFLGYKPCSAKKLCASCDEYEPWEKKIAILKLGALGDVLRTTPILKAFRRKYPKAHITWITKKNAKNMLDSNPDINRLLFVDESDDGGVLRLQVEKFDELHCYDKEDPAIALASLIQAKKKYGFFMNAEGHMAPINKKSEYCYDLGLSDQLKFFENKKTYQEVTYDCSELKPPKPMDDYQLVVTKEDHLVAVKVIKKAKWKSKGPIIGLNTGSGRVFLTKQWSEKYFLELAKLLVDQLGARILLLGGKDENERNQRLAKSLGNAAYYPGGEFTIREFAAVVGSCDAMVTGDTLAMHLALAAKVRTAILFGSTCDQEVEGYGNGHKLVSRPDCAPCYKNNCDQPDHMKCMNDITPKQVFNKVKEILQ